MEAYIERLSEAEIRAGLRLWVWKEERQWLPAILRWMADELEGKTK